MTGKTFDLILNLLLDNYPQTYNINQISKKIHMSVGGVFKVLNQMEKEGVLAVMTLGNAKYYKLNLKDELARKYCELRLVEKRKELPDLVTPLEDHLDKVLIILKEGKRLSLVTPEIDETSKKRLKKLLKGYSVEFVTYGEFKSLLRERLHEYWKKTIMYGESLMLRLISELNGGFV
ncbi:MAG: hypothetical protein ACTSPB_04580 [Candidatus Thorarchaeota archaeon]